MRAVIYARVSTAEQAEGHSIEYQVRACAEWCESRDIEVEQAFLDAGESGGVALDERRSGRAALCMLASGGADMLVALRLDRITRSLADWADLAHRSQRDGWALRTVEDGIDLGTAAGELLAAVLAAAAQYERRLIRDRTMEGLSEARARGARLGRPPHDPATLAQVRMMMDRGLGYKRIMEALNRQGLPRPGKARAYPWTIGATRGAMRAARQEIVTSS